MSYSVTTGKFVAGSGNPLSLATIRNNIRSTDSGTVSLNDTDLRRIAGKTSGAISIGDFNGKAWRARVNFSGNTHQANISSILSSNGLGSWVDRLLINHASGTKFYTNSSGVYSYRFGRSNFTEIVTSGTFQAFGAGGTGGRGAINHGNNNGYGGGTGGAAGKRDGATDAESKINNSTCFGGGGGGGGGGNGHANGCCQYGQQRTANGGGGGGGYGWNGGAGGGAGSGGHAAGKAGGNGGTGGGGGGGAGGEIRSNCQPHITVIGGAGGRGGNRASNGSKGDNGAFYDEGNHCPTSERPKAVQQRNIAPDNHEVDENYTPSLWDSIWDEYEEPTQYVWDEIWGNDESETEVTPMATVWDEIWDVVPATEITQFGTGANGGGNNGNWHA
ncbi:hypothetical protein [Vibrio campbellii]|uniref:hypothetical protein n=1 Tax=Vibrio campbellii TaxID=680 RepID=UPI003F86BB36